jgi:hypothetical protein
MEEYPAAQSRPNGDLLAALYGKAVLADPVKKAAYETKAQVKGIPAFALTVADFLHAPAVEEIDLSGDTGKAGETIRIAATDRSGQKPTKAQARG